MPLFSQYHFLGQKLNLLPGIAVEIELQDCSSAGDVRPHEGRQGIDTARLDLDPATVGGQQPSLHNMLRREAIEIGLGRDARAEREPKCMGAGRAVASFDLASFNLASFDLASFDLAIQAGDIAAKPQTLPKGKPTVSPAFERGIRHQIFGGQAGEAVLEFGHDGLVGGDARVTLQRDVIQPERAGRYQGEPEQRIPGRDVSTRGELKPVFLPAGGEGDQRLKDGQGGRRHRVEHSHG